jgi:hypothetical protein
MACADDLAILAAISALLSEAITVAVRIVTENVLLSGAALRLTAPAPWGRRSHRPGLSAGGSIKRDIPASSD